MQNSFPYDTPIFFSLLWPDENLSNSWKRRPARQEYFFKDLCIAKVLDSLEFGERSRKKAEELFKKLCTDEGVIKYRLDIIQDFVDNKWLSDAFKDFEKAMANIDRSSENKYPNPKEIHIHTCFFEKMAAYVPLISEIKSCLEEGKGQILSEGLKRLLDYVSHIESTDVFSNMQEDVRLITAEYENLSDILLEFGYYEGLREVAIHTENKADVTNMQGPLISRILKHAAALLDEKDRRFCSIYYDVRFSRLEELILERPQIIRPAVFTRLREFYDRYSDYNITMISELKFEVEFYLKFTELAWKMKNAGLQFCKPAVRVSEAGNTGVRGLYDLSLSLQLKEGGRNNLFEYIVTNDLSFDENGRLFVLTGPNKGGKTTFIRSVGLAQILFQTGCFVPAAEARMAVIDSLYTHFPVEETIDINKGRLGEEAERISVILNNATSKSMVLLNETFSSTRRIDGYYLGRDLLKILMQINCMCIYVTHFNELACDVDEINREVSGTSRLANLFAGIDDSDGQGLTGDRTFVISHVKPKGLGYSRDIVTKHGLSAGQLAVLLKKRGYLPANREELA